MKYDFVKMFDEYCEEQEFFLKQIPEYNRKQSEYREAIMRVNDPYSLCEILDYKVRNSREERIKRFILKFYDFLKERDIEIFTRLDDLELDVKSLQRKLKLAKFLHNNPSLEDIEAEFLIKEGAIKKDIAALENGLHFMDSTVCLNINKNNGKYECSTTVHPIFLPLNLSEVYVLTKYLPKILNENNIHNDIINCFIDRIILQLSDYAIDKLDLIKTSNMTNQFMEEDLTKRDERLIAYALKSQSKCMFTIDGKDKEGKFLSYEQIQLDDEQEPRLFDIKKIDFWIL